MDASLYIAVLQNNLLQSIEDILDEQRKHFIFQLDNAPLHRASMTKNVLRYQGIDVLPWPAQDKALA